MQPSTQTAHFPVLLASKPKTPLSLYTHVSFQQKFHVEQMIFPNLIRFCRLTMKTWVQTPSDIISITSGYRDIEDFLVLTMAETKLLPKTTQTFLEMAPQLNILRHFDELHFCQVSCFCEKNANFFHKPPGLEDLIGTSPNSPQRNKLVRSRMPRILHIMVIVFEWIQ